MTNIYEMMFILRPDLSGEQVNKQLHKYSNFLKTNGAEKVSMEVWGKRRLAYPIQRFLDGIYVLTYYNGDGTQVAKIEREMRFSEEVIRYLTIKQDPEFEFEEKAIPELQISPPQPQTGDSPKIEKIEKIEKVEKVEKEEEKEASSPETKVAEPASEEEETPVEA